MKSFRNVELSGKRKVFVKNSSKKLIYEIYIEEFDNLVFIEHTNVKGLEKIISEYYDFIKFDQKFMNPFKENEGELLIII